MAEKAFQTLLCESEERTFAFIALATEGEGELGRLVFELFPSLAPKTVDNFFALCAKESGGYVGSAIHRIKPGGWFQGGDVVTGGGNGGAAASGSGLPDESFHIKHSEYGILGMANNGKPHSATSQFYVTFAPTPSFDGHYGAFGARTATVAVCACCKHTPRTHHSHTMPHAHTTHALAVAACGRRQACRRPQAARLPRGL